MRIYVTHSTSFDFRNDLYDPIRNSELNSKHEIVLPHENSIGLFDSKSYLDNCNLVIAEVSYPSTGQGIELGWADIKSVPIVCIYKVGATISGSLKAVCQEILEYTSTSDMVSKIAGLIDKFEK